jgi:HEAT repeat protein
MKRIFVRLLALLLVPAGAARADQFLDGFRVAVKDLGRQDASVEVRCAALDTIAATGNTLKINTGAIFLLALTDPKEAVRVKAARTIRQLGPTIAQFCIQGSRLVKALEDRSPVVRGEVISALVQAGRLEPKRVLPALVRVLQEDDSPELRLRAAAALGRIYLGLGPGSEGDPVENLGSNHPVEQIAAYVPVLRDACKAVTDALKDADEQVRFKAARTIVELGPTAAQGAVHELIQALQEKKPRMRAQVVWALGLAGRQRPGLVVPEVVRALKDENRHVRLMAAGIFGGLGPAAREGVPDLIEALKETDKFKDDLVGWQSVREAALWSLWWMGPAAKPAIPAVVEMLDSSDPQVRRDVLRVLEAVGDSDDRVAPALLKALQHKEKEVRVLAAVNLGQMGPKYAKEALPLLLDGLDVGDVRDQSPGGQAQSRQYLIVRALGRMGPAAAEAVPRLREILNDPKRDYVHPAVKEALKKFER